MTRTLWRLAVVAVLATLGLPIGIVVAPGQRSVLVRLTLLIVGGCILVAIVHTAQRAAATAGPSSDFDPPRRRRRGGAKAPAALASLERRLRLASLHAGDVHHYVRPIVRDIAADRLALRRGLNLDSTQAPEVAQIEQVLGPLVWDLARPGRPRPDDPLGPGLTEAQLQSAVETLEAL